ncbi:Error-prone DNA polymerase [Tepidimonas alkaliphilus]|uniref:Error-prone DNA polymerase n=1 Tax=Tepidimonas alkaliphilus TaxID=2588942 RepID=A0A554WDK2_9BURK|nr:error-prone DNA polymerase [Tepidimonas alkaliphilus]TSE21636.1 Error-prone DNA polymerase [Tepidimonas alkaliphilus]
MAEDAADAPAAATARGAAQPVTLWTQSAYAFGEACAAPEALVARAHALGHAALALTDACTLGGVVRAHVAARRLGLPLIVGAHWRLQHPALPGGGFTLLALAMNRAGYGAISDWISRLRQRGAPLPPVPHDPWQLPLHAAWDEAPPLPGCAVVALPWSWALPQAPRAQWRLALAGLAQALRRRFGMRVWLGASADGWLHDAAWIALLTEAGRRGGLPVAAVPQVRMAEPGEQALLDVLTATRLHRPLPELGLARQPHAEAHLWTARRWRQRYPAALRAEAHRIAALCRFRLDELRYEYPPEVVPPGRTPAQHLRALAFEGAARRYPHGIPDGVRHQLERELALIAELRYEAYFLTVHDIVRFARSRGILCQGRGSAANSAVCYCLGITEVDPARSQLLFERFISRARAEPPDIDVDFEHQRREEVIQYLYARYGRARAALAASTITWQPASAVRAVGRALAMPQPAIERLARWCRRRAPQDLPPQALQEAGLEAGDAGVARWLALAQALLDLPRHRGQHTGGFVLARQRLTLTVPVVPAAMAGRTVVEWDKDDLEALGMLKVDVLALGMLSALRGALDLAARWRGRALTLADIPAEDAATWAMIQRADTVGVFQIESRAQMSMLPRLRPACFYDLVVQVAIVRPGPIQGGMVHPYLAARARQRLGLPPKLPHPDLEPALRRTLGVPIFQEQVMQIAMLAAGFSAEEADALRRAMGAWRRKGGLAPFEDRLRAGMAARGYPADFVERLVRQIRGFGDYGFPESHAASFALLAWASAWLKCHEPAAFLAALLNAQPMGFYAPAQLVQDARRHGVEVRPVDVTRSDWDCTLEPPADPAAGQPAVRLGLRLVHGLGEPAARRLVAARAQRAFLDLDDLATRARLTRTQLRALAQADALQALAGSRRQQWWQASAWQPPLALAEGVGAEAATAAGRRLAEPAPALPAATLAEEVWADYAALGLSLRAHPLALLRARLPAGCRRAAELPGLAGGRRLRVAGLVTARQRPATARGTLFLTLEDETGSVQVIVRAALAERTEAVWRSGQLLIVEGRWQRLGAPPHAVGHLVAWRLAQADALLRGLRSASHDFH